MQKSILAFFVALSRLLIRDNAIVYVKKMIRSHQKCVLFYETNFKKDDHVQVRLAIPSSTDNVIFYSTLQKQYQMQRCQSQYQMQR